MTSDENRPSLAANVRRQPYKSPMILLVSTLLTTTWWYFGLPVFFENHLPDGFRLYGDAAATAAKCSFLATFALFGLVPALIVKFVFRERLSDYGVQLGNRFRTCRSFLLFAPGVLLIAWLSSKNPAIRAYYPLNRSAGAARSTFGVHAAMYLLFYTAWEFHFRGFLQHGLRGTMGDVQAILVQILASTLAHLGRPAIENLRLHRRRLALGNFGLSHPLAPLRNAATRPAGHRVGLLPVLRLTHRGTPRRAFPTASFLAGQRPGSPFGSSPARRDSNCSCPAQNSQPISRAQQGCLQSPRAGSLTRSLPVQRIAATSSESAQAASPSKSAVV